VIESSEYLEDFCAQKFSINHKLVSTVQPRIAKWRPSGEGTP
jgi:hypothetical protein